jgi:hypothetical protein
MVVGDKEESIGWYIPNVVAHAGHFCKSDGKKSLTEPRDPGQSRPVTDSFSRQVISPLIYSLEVDTQSA